MLTINQAVRDHQLSTEWVYQDVCILCWMFFDRFRELHFPDLADCYFHVEAADRRSRLIYSTGDNGIGAEHDCLLNSRWLGRPVYEVAGHVMHALVHMWLESVGKHSICGGHNKAFQLKAAELGIFADGRLVCKVLYPASSAFIADVASIDADYMRPCRSDIKDPVMASKHDLVYDCACKRITLPGKVDLICADCNKPLVIVTDLDMRKYRCGCEEISLHQAVNFVCAKCGQPMKEIF